MKVFQDYSYYYNAFYQDKDYKKEAGEVDILLKKYGVNPERIINYGCGTGRHDIELTKLGYCCLGIDMSPLMISIARKNAENQKVPVGFSIADIRKYEPIERYDAVISLFHVMSYQNTNEDILDALNTARKALDRNGIFLFDVWYGPGVLTDRPVIRIKEVHNHKHRLVRIARPLMHDKTNVVDVSYEIFIMDNETGETETINEVHSMRYYFRPELEFLLEKTGFKLLDVLDCQTLEETNYNTWTSYFIAKAV